MILLRSFKLLLTLSGVAKYRKKNWVSSLSSLFLFFLLSCLVIMVMSLDAVIFTVRVVFCESLQNLQSSSVVFSFSCFFSFQQTPFLFVCWFVCSFVSSEEKSLKLHLKVVASLFWWSCFQSTRLIYNENICSFQSSYLAHRTGSFFWTWFFSLFKLSSISLLLQNGWLQVHNDIWEDLHFFGVNPIWKQSENELTFTSSLKMKMSLVLGITQMMFGFVLCLHFASHRYRCSAFRLFIWRLFFLFFCCLFFCGSWTKLDKLLSTCVFSSFFFFRQFFLCSILRFMILFVVVKWMTYFRENTHCVPSILNTLISLNLFESEILLLPMWMDCRIEWECIQCLLLFFAHTIWHNTETKTQQHNLGRTSHCWVWFIVVKRQNKEVLCFFLFVRLLVLRFRFQNTNQTVLFLESKSNCIFLSSHPKSSRPCCQ